MTAIDELSLAALDEMTGKLVLLCDIGHQLMSAGLAPVFDLSPGEEGIIRLPVILPGFTDEDIFTSDPFDPDDPAFIPGPPDIVIEPEIEQTARCEAGSPQEAQGGLSVGEGGRSSTQTLPDAPDPAEAVFDSPIPSPWSVAVEHAAEVPQDTKPEVAAPAQAGVEAPAVAAATATAGAATDGPRLGPLTEDERHFIAAHAQLGWKSAMIAEALNRKVQTIGLYMANLPKAEAPEPEPAPAPKQDSKPGTPMTPILTHLFGLPTKGWTTEQDHELMELSCNGWGYAELQIELKRQKSDLVARFDLLTGLYRDANDKPARRFKREDVLAALASLLPAAKLE